MRRPAESGVLVPAALVLLAASVTMLARVWEGDLSSDEVLYAAVAKRMAVGGGWLDPQLGDAPYWKKPPLVFWMHAPAEGRHWLERWARRTTPDLVVCNSRFTAESAKSLYRKDAVNVLERLATIIVFVGNGQLVRRRLGGYQSVGGVPFGCERGLGPEVDPCGGNDSYAAGFQLPNKRRVRDAKTGNLCHISFVEPCPGGYNSESVKKSVCPYGRPYVVARPAENSADSRAATQGRPYVTSIFSQLLSRASSALGTVRYSWVDPR